MSNKKIISFVECSDGRRQLFDRIIPKIPQTYNRYFEFFIREAVLFELSEKFCD